VTRWLPVSLAAAMFLGRLAGRVKDRAEPGRGGGAGGVLEAPGRALDDMAAGNRSQVI